MGKTITAREIVAGMQIAGQDGWLWNVDAVEPVGKASVRVTISSDFSSFASHWKKNGGVVKTLRASSRVVVAA